MSPARRPDARAGTPRRGRRRRLARAAFAAGLCALVAALALEAGLRAGGAPAAVAHPLHGFHRSDPVLGWIGTPDLRRRFVRPAFDVLVEHDADGFRRPDPPPPAEARDRVLVLGDSLVWGWGVAQGELFTDQLQRALAPEVAVSNRGVNAYATSQELLLLERELARDPWSSVLVFFTPGDLAENVDGKGGRRPIFVLEDGRLVPRNQPAAPLMGPWRRWWKDTSFAWLWLELNANRLRERLARAMPEARAGAASPEPGALTGVAVTARVLAEMRDRSRAAGADFHVVYVPAEGELGAGPADPRASAAHAFLTGLASAEGLPLVDLTPALAARSEGRGLRFAEDEHPDARGHRLIAEALLDAGVLARPARPPDVILLTLDTTRADRLGVLGYPRPITPSLDRLARDSTTFRRAWSTSSWTLPAHASILTGKRPGSHGADQGLAKEHPPLGSATSPEYLAALLPHPLDEGETTLAELLAARGYATAAFVGGPYLLPPFGLLQGYQHRDVALPADGKRRADALTDAAIAWLEGVPRGRPVHLLVNYFDPHAPYDPPPGYDDLPQARRPLPEPDLERISGGELADRSAYVDRYDGEVRFMDFHLGRLLAALARLGRYDGALIIAVGDHGELLGEHGLMQHGHALYEEVMHVPLIVHYPGGRDRGRVRDETVSIVDMLTLVGREVGLELPAGVEGLPLGEREVAWAESPRSAHFVQRYGAEFDRDLSAVVRWPWKLIDAGSGAALVYRLDGDPGEAKSLGDAAEVRELRQALAAERSTLRPRARGAKAPELTPEGIEQLRALGYLPR